MKTLFLTILIVGFCGCKKDITSTPNPTVTTIDSINRAKFIIYSDIFVMLNCKMDSIEVYIDSIKVGTLTTPFLPLNTVPSYGVQNTLSIKTSIGYHTIYATSKGCQNRFWSYIVNIIDNQENTLNLKSQNSLPDYSNSKNNSANVIGFDYTKCNCCWGYLFQIDKDTILSDDKLINSTIGEPNTINFPLQVKIDIGAKKNDCQYSKKYNIIKIAK